MSATSAGLDERTDAWVRSSVAALGDGTPRIVGVHPLIGGLSGSISRLDLAGGGLDAVVLRQALVDDAWHRECVSREVAGLAAMEGAPVVAPRMLADDPEGGRTGRPATLTTFVDGNVDLDPADSVTWLEQLADALVLIHEQPPSPDAIPHDLFRDLGPALERPWLAALPVGAAAIDLARTAPQTARPRLAHGDYQHFNVLWRGERLSAVVDWAFAGTADPGKDVGHCMLNLAVLYSAERALDFLRRYSDRAGRRVDPAALALELLDYSDDWPEFISLQVAGRYPVDAAGMPGRVAEVLESVVRLAG